MDDFIISDIKARQVLDARGDPAVEVDVFLDDEVFGRAAVASGDLENDHSVVNLRDNEPEFFDGKGVFRAVWNVNSKIRDVLVGNSANQKIVDQLMREIDGTPDKSNLGANAILAVSLATAKAVAKKRKMPFYEYVAELAGTKKQMAIPMPLISITKECAIVPVGAGNITEAIRIGAEVFYALRKVLKKEKCSHKADECTRLAVEEAGYKLDKDVKVVLGANGATSIEPSRFGTLSETIEAFLTAIKNDHQVIVSHSLGETEDVAIAHIAVGLGAGQIKIGPLFGGERISKYNELIRIAESNSRLKLFVFFGNDAGTTSADEQDGR